MGAEQRPGVVPGPAGLSLTAEEWLVLGLLASGVVAVIAVLLVPVGPFAHSLDVVPYKDYVGILIALVAGGIAGLALGQWWDYRPGGSGWRSRPPPVPAGSTGIQSASSFEIYSPDTADKRRRR
jgi:hypothetical protein